MKTTASEFCRNFGRFQLDAQREPVEVTSHGRVTGYFVSAVEFGYYQELKRREREVLEVGRLPDDVIEAIAAADYPEDRDDLDKTKIGEPR
jgi:hypothetical protein